MTGLGGGGGGGGGGGSMGEGLVKLVTCSDVDGRWVDIWRSDTFPSKPQRHIPLYVRLPLTVGGP